MKVFLTGSTGYVGRQVVRDLIAAGHAVVCLVRPGSEGKLPREVAGRVDIVRGDILETKTYRDRLQSCEAIINLPGLLREFPRRGITFEGVHYAGPVRLIDEAKKANVARFIHMSALGVRQDAIPKYQETKYRAEEYLKSSGLRWTVFRPSLMFGNEKEGLMNFMSVLKDLLNIAPLFVPVLGSGNYRFQPVAVQDVSQGFVRALVNESSVGKIYDVAGPDRYTYNELLDVVSYITGRNKIKFHQPMFLMKIAASMFGGYSFFPVSRDQITMLEEENISDRWEDFFRDFGFAPRRLMEHVHEGF